jgi:hypothetical protein
MEERSKQNLIVLLFFIMYYNNSLVRFKNNKPYLFKKIFVTLAVAAFTIYSYAQLDPAFAIIFTLIVGTSLVFKIRKQPTEGKGFSGKVRTFYKNLYRHFIVDVLPVNIKIDNDQIVLVLQKAEIIKRHVVDEKFVIKKDKIANILYDDVDEDILIMFEEALITAKDVKTDKVIRKLFQFNSTICFRIAEDTSIVQQLTNFNYSVEKLSEIEDEPEETEDPELVNLELTETGEQPNENETNSIVNVDENN